MRPFTAVFIVCASLAMVASARPEISFYDAYRQRHGLQRRAGNCHRRPKSGTGTSAAAAARSSSTPGGEAAPSAGTGTKETESATAANTESTAAGESASADGGAGRGLMSFSDDGCGDSGAREESSEDGGPNGAQSWLNCGLSKENPEGKWIKVSQIKTLTLEEALAKGSLYEPCKPHIKLFEKYGEEYGIPPILLAAFAMLENAQGTGPYGLMQITDDKCGDAPGGNCAEADYNVKTGAAYFAQVLKDHHENLLLAMGTYNGWYDGLTYNKATAAKDSGCCVCQNNLDYMQQMLNGWVMGIDGHSLGTIHNLNVCSG
ncbi:uncharacterized protein JCM10292_002055 [Rhodotorula paludigena]|uniref:uncharacterized protein n=1 Tax=Rhodotorula paludigena TaxID=86838 RepID=UPI00317C0CAC